MRHRYSFNTKKSSTLNPLNIPTNFSLSVTTFASQTDQLSGKPSTQLRADLHPRANTFQLETE